MPICVWYTPEAEKTVLSVNAITARKLNVLLNPEMAGTAEIKIE